MIFVNYSVIDHELSNKIIYDVGKVTKSPSQLARTLAPAYLGGSNKLMAYLFFIYDINLFRPIRFQFFALVFKYIVLWNRFLFILYYFLDKPKSSEPGDYEYDHGAFLGDEYSETFDDLR